MKSLKKNRELLDPIESKRNKKKMDNKNDPARKNKKYFLNQYSDNYK